MHSRPAWTASRNVCQNQINGPFTLGRPSDHTLFQPRRHRAGHQGLLSDGTRARRVRPIRTPKHATGRSLALSPGSGAVRLPLVQQGCGSGGTGGLRRYRGAGRSSESCRCGDGDRGGCQDAHDCPARAPCAGFYSSCIFLKMSVSPANRIRPGKVRRRHSRIRPEKVRRRHSRITLDWSSGALGLALVSERPGSASEDGLPVGLLDQHAFLGAHQRL